MKFKTKPYKHQLQGFELQKDEEAFALFMDTGTGKSKLAIDTAVYLYEQQQIDGMLLVAINGVHENWGIEHFKQHCAIPYDYICWHNGLPKYWQSEFDRLTKTETDKFVLFAINIEALSTKVGEKYSLQFLKRVQSMMVIDESSFIKTPTSGRTKSCMRLSKHAPYRRILSGTPGLPLDYYSQFKFLDDELWPFKNFGAYKEHFCEMRPLPGKYTRYGSPIQIVEGYKNLRDIGKFTNPLIFRADKNKCLDLPDKIICNQYVDLLPKQRKYYDQLKDELLIENDQGEEIVTMLVIQKIIRLHQIANGHVPFENKPVIFDENKKVKLLVNLLKENYNKKCVVWCYHKAEQAFVKKALVKEFGTEALAEYLDNKKGRINEKQKFLDNEKCWIFFSSPSAAAYGHNLQCACLMYFYSCGYKYMDYIQCQDRIWRAGQKNKVVITNIIARDTIDEHVMNAVNNNIDLMENLLRKEVQHIL